LYLDSFACNICRDYNTLNTIVTLHCTALHCTALQWTDQPSPASERSKETSPRSHR
jgi:hypothetical protein